MKIKRKKALIIFICIVVTIPGCLILYLKDYDKGMMVAAKTNRISKLISWHRELTDFINEGNPVPDSLYDFCRIIGEVRYSVVRFGFPQHDNSGELLADLKIFNSKVEYGFFKGEHGWFIKELNSGHYLPYMLMIDEKGNIFEVIKDTSIKDISQRY